MTGYKITTLGRSIDIPDRSDRPLNLIDRLYPSPKKLVMFLRRGIIERKNARNIPVVPFHIPVPEIWQPVEKLRFFLIQFSKEFDDDFVKLGVAENPNTPSYILARFAESNDRCIKLALAENNNTPLKILEKLARDREAQSN